MSTRSRQIKHEPKMFRGILSICILTFSLSISKPSYVTVFFILVSLALLVELFLLTWAIVCRFITQPKDIQFEDDSLKVFHKEIVADDIQKIIIRGYFFQTIGILPKNKKIVPSHMSFKFTGNEEEGIQELKEWAKQVGVPVEHGSYVSWI